MQNPPNMRILCVNCNIIVNTLRRHRVFELDTRAISVICEWISPVIVTEEDYICDACWQLILQTINTALENEPTSSSSRGLGHSQVCILCGRSLINRQRHLIIRDNPSALQRAMEIEIENRAAPRQVTATGCVCHPCWLSVKRSIHQMQDNEQHPPQVAPVVAQEAHVPEPLTNSTEDVNEELPHQLQQAPTGTIILNNYRRAANTANHCIFHQCQNMDLHRISDALRATTLAEHKYYIPLNARVCGEHLESNNWNMLFESENSLRHFTIEQLEHVFSFVNAFNTFLDFSSLQGIEQTDDHLFKYWLGMSKEQFNTLLNEVPRVLETPQGLLGLGAFLMKMRTGDSDDRLSQLLRVPRRTLERLMNKVRDILLQDFVPRNLGLNHITREELLQRNLMIPNAIFNANNLNAIIICDGTYIYINKSSNYMFQKDTYSLHKYRNLLKPFMLVTSDGYIVDCLGPYKATTSDADIMKSLLRDENSPLRQNFRDNDIFILDRGFRDAVSSIEACSFKAYLPENLLEGENQLTTQQANNSRCVTICRWVVEVVNGYFKRDFKIFRQEYFNKSVPQMMQCFSIAASLINRFGVRLTNRNDASQIIAIMRERFNYDNNLSNVVNRLNMNRRTSSFINITADTTIAFPRLEYNELILFALGTYQIRQARSYYGEHIRYHGRYEIEVSREDINVFEYNLRGSGNNKLIRGKIKSRHVSRKLYYVYILIENNASGREAIQEYCCNCIVGRRTVGCCAHVMTIIWYLGWARHQSNVISAPAGFLDSVVVREDDE